MAFRLTGATGSPQGVSTVTGTPTRITSLGVVPCYQHGGHGTVICTALEEFCLTVNESGLLFSWYLRGAGGVPARHQELTIVARDDPAEVVNSSEFSPMDWDFEQMDALVDFSISYLADNQRESAALSWLPTAVHAQARRWGSSTEPLDMAYRAALALDPSLITRPARGPITALGDDPDLSEADFWTLIDLLSGTADDAGCARMRGALQACGRAVIDGFARLLDIALATLDTAEHINPPVNPEDPPVESELPFSTDTFRYVRCDVVVSGRDTWLRVANHPSAMAGAWNIESERLLMVVPVVPSLRPST